MKAISDAALLYALRELSRRAGVSFEFFMGWSVTRIDEGLVVQPEPDSQGTIFFPVFRREGQTQIRVARKTWGGFANAKARSTVPGFVVPFSDARSFESEPLFVQDAAREFRCTEDLLSSLLLTLCRIEERESRSTDLHGRFPSTAGIAEKNGFLDRPIVDEYGLAFQEVLQAAVPRWQPLPRNLRVKLSHDIDEIGIPFSLRSAAGHMMLRRSPGCGMRDFLSVMGDVEPGYLHAVQRICELDLERGLRPTLYWQSSETDPFDTGYDVFHPKIARVMAWADERGLEQGVHPGYRTFRSRELLEREVRQVKKALGREQVGGRQHYLRWYPDTWSDWESCGLAYDSSAGFVDQVGFRCGTSIPYMPWMLESDRSADLLEIPLIAADGTLVQHMGLSLEQSKAVVRDLMEKCDRVGGVFTLLWHNTGLFPPCKDFYLPLLEMLRGAEGYDWQNDLQELRKERKILAEKGVSLRGGLLPPECKNRLKGSSPEIPVSSAGREVMPSRSLECG